MEEQEKAAASNPVLAAAVAAALAAGGAQINDEAKSIGTVLIELRGPDGKIKETRVANLVVTSGKCAIASRLGGTATAVPSHMAVGTDNTAAAVTQAALGAEVAASRTALVSTAISNTGVTFSTTFPAGTGTGALTEAGLFNGATAVAAGLSYTRTTTVVSVTKASHGLAANRAIGIASATDTGVNGGATIATVPDANTFTFATSASGANGTLSLYQDVMLARVVFAVVNKGAADTLTVTWTITQS